MTAYHIAKAANNMIAKEYHAACVALARVAQTLLGVAGRRLTYRGIGVQA